MQTEGLGGKIEVEAKGVISTFSPLIDPIFNRGENQMTSETISKICSIEGCSRPFHARRFCKLHYSRWLRKGHTNADQPNNRGVGNTPEARFWSRIDKTLGQGPNGDCWGWQASGSLGYGSVFLFGRAYKAHRAAWFYTYGVMPSRWLLHSCDNPSCCNPAHLREGTHQDNMRDKVERNRQSRGVVSNRTHLTDDDIRDIRRDYQPRKVTHDMLAERYQVSSRTIYDIVTRRHWRHVT